ncbi:MAG TPA: sporulation protein YunB [bacterium]|jgi:sporulation protein YunB|nr:sporulation protein YunB [bacterium]
MGGRQCRRQYIPLLILLISSFSIGILLVVERNVGPMLMTVAETKAKIMTIKAINLAINREVVAATKFQELIIIHKDIEGKVTLIQPNTVEISRLAATASTSIQEQLETMRKQRVAIPAGQVFRSALLANFGPRIMVSIVPLGTVRINVNSDFKNAGINQTLHQLILEIEADVQVVIPLARSTTSVSTSMPLSQTVVVGEVPQHYWQLYSSDR